MSPAKADILFKRRDSHISFSDRLRMLTEAQEEGNIEKIESRISFAGSPEEKKGWEKRKKLNMSFDKTCTHN